jgi:hypothetical protein
MFTAVKKLTLQLKNTATSGQMTIRAVCVWCGYACILGIDDGDLLGSFVGCYAVRIVRNSNSRFNTWTA